MFHGLTHSAHRASLGYAVLEGVSFGLADGLNALKQSGTSIQQCSLVGGGSRSAFWAQLLADVLGVTVVTHRGGESGGALGAARLAAIANGASIQEMCTKPEVQAVYESQPNRSGYLTLRYEQFKALYGKLRVDE